MGEKPHHHNKSLMVISYIFTKIVTRLPACCLYCSHTYGSFVKDIMQHFLTSIANDCLLIFH